MRSIRYILLCLVVILSSCSNAESRQVLTIATSANLRYAMEEIATEFSEKTDIKCDLIISSSGKLTAQIKEGAPYDLLVAANLKYPEDIYRSGMAKNPPKVYAYGKLALWSMSDSHKASIDFLKSDSVTHIALANPKTAPYGVAAMQVLEHYGLYEEVKDKLVFGESISQVNQFVNSQAAEVGFTAMAVVLSEEMKGQGSWIEIDTSAYDPIKQGIVIIERSSKKTARAMEFSKFIFSADAKRILTKFGYTVDE